MHDCNKLSRRSHDNGKQINLKEEDGTKSAALAMWAYKGMWELDQEWESYGSIVEDADSRFSFFFISFTKSGKQLISHVSSSVLSQGLLEKRCFHPPFSAYTIFPKTWRLKTQTR